jgi:hypothetical protein
MTDGLPTAAVAIMHTAAAAAAAASSTGRWVACNTSAAQYMRARATLARFTNRYDTYQLH